MLSRKKLSSRFEYGCLSTLHLTILQYIFKLLHIESHRFEGEWYLHQNIGGLSWRVDEVSGEVEVLDPE